MQQARLSQKIVRFGVFEVNLDAVELRKAGVKLKIQDQPFQILSLLLERRGEIVTREELQQQLWPDGTFVDFEHGVNTAVKKIREVLGDDADSPRFVETVPRRGYRFIASIDGPGPPPQLPEISEPHPSSPRRRTLIVCGLLAVALAALVTWRVIDPGRAAPKMRDMVQLTFNGCCPEPELTHSLQSDGKRIYFSDASLKLSNVSVKGGQREQISTDLQSAAVLLHLSPDGSTFLVRDFFGSEGGSESPLWLVPAGGGAPRRLGDIEAHAAAWSPDGQTIAFSHGESLYLCDSRAQNQRKISTFTGRPVWIRWSPDGRTIRFTLRDNKSGSAKLWETDLQGSAHPLLATWKPDVFVCCGVWAPSGDYFFLSDHDGSPQVWSLRKASLFSRRVEPTRVTIPGTGTFVSLAASPTENKLFVLGRRAIPEIFAVDPVTKQAKQLVPNLVPVGMNFSADGKWTTFVQHHEEKSELWSARADGTGLVQLTEPPLQPYMPVSSPDGSRIAFVGKLPDQPYKVYWVPSQGGALHALSSEVIHQVDPGWLPDGQSIIFGEPPNSWVQSDKPKAIYISNLKTQQTSKVPGSDGWFSPRVSPDGRYLCAMSLDFKKLGLFDFRDGKWRNFTENELIDGPFWSRDSKTVYFTNGSDQLWKVRVADGHKEQVMVFSSIFPSSSCLPHGFTPDGLVIFSCFGRNPDIYALNLE